jgi:UDP-glucose 4-epimerase
VYDSLEYGHKEALLGGTLIQGDLCDIKRLTETFDEYSIQAVVHFAAYASVGDSVANPNKYFQNNISNGLNLMEAIRMHDIKNIIFSSSASTYGEPQNIPIIEDDKQNPTNPYGETKLMFEKILKWYDIAYGIKSISLRYFNASGADPKGRIGEDHKPEEHLIPIVLQTALGQRKDVKIFGTDWDTPDGSCIRDFIHVDDIADAHVKALQALADGGETTAYNMGNGDGQSVKQVIQAASDVTGKKIPYESINRRPGDPARLVASSNKLKSELEWRPKYPDLHTIIEHAWRWHSENPHGYNK